MMPLWASAIVSREKIGCALSGTGAPCVAQRVCASPIPLAKPAFSTCAAKSSTRAMLRTRRGAPSVNTAMPHESYPQYSRRLNPSIKTGTILCRAIALTMPHIEVSKWLLFKIFFRTFFRPPVAQSGNLRFFIQRERAFGNVFPNRRSGGNRCAARNAHRRDQLRIRADKNIVFDHCAMFARAVVVARDGASAGVDARADIRVADIAQLIDFRALLEMRAFDFDEVADMDFIIERRARTQARVRADHRTRADIRLLNMGERADHGAGIDHGIFEHAVRPDAHAVTQHNAAFKNAIHINRYIASAFERAAHVDARRIRQPHAIVE